MAASFAQRLLAWHAEHGRTELPWQHNKTPYRVWLSEIMLQQTQVATVIDYFNRFTERFPSVAELAAAELDEVLHLWTGLGYYARGRNLHKTARLVVEQHNGEFPQTQAELEALPGIGRSTAGAIRAIAFKQHAAILDGNVKRVLARYHAVEGYPGVSKVAKRLWTHAEQHTPARETDRYTQSIMDLGATLCTAKRPQCERCPVNLDCAAKALERTADFPGKKPKKEKPARKTRMLIVRREDGAVLLEQAPLEGIWGGLWSPLQRNEGTPASVCNQLGLELTELNQGETFRHTFSHYHLDIEPVYLQVRGSLAPTVQDADALVWYRTGANQAIGLSAPAVKLLAQLTQVDS